MRSDAIRDDPTTMTPARDHAGVYVPPPLLYLLPFLAGIILHRTVGHDAFPPEWKATSNIAGIVFVVAGIILTVVANIIFRRARTAMIPIHPATTVVTWGPYRFTRNPMYLSLALAYVGAALLAGYAWPFAGLPVAILAVDRYVIPREERYLEEKFGDTYRGYRESVRRWL